MLSRLPSSRALALTCLVAGSCVLGCASGPDTVTLTLLTDFEPGEQFASARYTFDADGSGRPSGVLEPEDFARGAELHSASTGPRIFVPRRQAYRVELLDAAGDVVAEATAENSFAGRGAQRVFLTITRSDCEGVLGCADDETCLCGGCYPRACREDASGADCPGSCCERAGRCPAPPAACAEVSCIESPERLEAPRCVWIAREASCDPELWCDALEGCVPRTYTPPEDGDAGSPDPGARDAGPYDVGSPDARGPIGPDMDGDGSPAGIDCDDSDDRRYPGAIDMCQNMLDEDCNGSEPVCAASDVDPGLTAASGACAARCCDQELFQNIPATDEGDCVREASPLCEGHGFVLRARWNGTVAYRREAWCWALCTNRMAYHRLLGVSSGCTELAAEYCAESDRGGLRDAIWSQCTPPPPP